MGTIKINIIILRHCSDESDSTPCFEDSMNCNPNGLEFAKVNQTFTQGPKQIEINEINSHNPDRRLRWS